MNMRADLWTYRARLVKVVDGDTVDLDVDLGFDVTHRIRVRLHGLDTPERSAGDRWRAATAATGQWFSTGSTSAWPLTVRTAKGTDKYGRWLGTIERSDGSVLNEMLLRDGFAVSWDGRGVHPS